MKRPPTTDEWLAGALDAMRATPRERTVFGPGGRHTEKTAGERVLLGPGGYPVRVIEFECGGTQIEEHDGDHLHAVVRPGTLTLDGYVINREGRIIRR